MFEDDGLTPGSPQDRGSEEPTTTISVMVSPEDRAKIQAAVAALQRGRETLLTEEEFVMSAAVQAAKDTLFIDDESI